jgi:peptidoglycan/LPS O-acetylase OafA/YrhL
MARRLSEIDGLRGLAAIAVMIGHWGEAIAAESTSLAARRVLNNLLLENFSFGRLGIVAFFCVSGFVVPFSFRGARPLLAFPISRAFRLYPAYWVSIAAAAIVYPLVDGPILSMRQILVNMTMLQLLLGEPHVIGAYWTLTIELIFYAICYLLFAARLLHGAWTNIMMVTLFLGIALATAVYRWINPQSDLPLGIPTYLAAMHFGALVRLALLEEDAIAKRLYKPTLALLLVGVVVANTLAYYHARNELVGWIAANTGYLVGIGLFMGCVLRKWFDGPRWSWLGQISYSTYLLHMIVIEAGVWAFAFCTDWWTEVAIITPCYFAITLATAALLRRWVELPSIHVGRITERFIETRLFNTPQRTVAP